MYALIHPSNMKSWDDFILALPSGHMTGSMTMVEANDYDWGIELTQDGLRLIDLDDQNDMQIQFHKCITRGESIAVSSASFIFDIDDGLQLKDYTFLKYLFNDPGLMNIELYISESCSCATHDSNYYVCYTSEDLTIPENHKHTIPFLFLNYAYHNLSYIISNKYIGMGG